MLSVEIRRRQAHPPTLLAHPLRLDRVQALVPRNGDAPLFPRWGNVRRDLAIACAEVKIACVTPNDLRRTFCTWLAEAGVPELVTASLMGHANSAMIRKVYARIGTAAQVQAIAQMPVALRNWLIFRAVALEISGMTDRGALTRGFLSLRSRQR